MSKYRNYDDDFIYDSSNYGKHISSMTGEQLHSKSDIAAELAYRDDLIEQQQREIDELSKPIDLEVAGDFLISELIDSDAENCREHHYGYENGNKYYIRVGEVGSEQPIEKLERLEQERDALTAHVAALNEFIDTWAPHYAENDREFTSILFTLKNQEPEHSLTEVRGRQARRSFREGVHYAKNSKTVSFEDIQAAEEHANKIRNGEDGDE